MVQRSINLRHLAPAERNRLIGKALEMRAAKYQVIEIAEALNIDRRTVCYWTNPQSREKSKARARASSREARNEAKRRERERNGNNNVGHTVIKGPSEADYQVRRGEMPQDTRSITERVFGDGPTRAVGDDAASPTGGRQTGTELCKMRDL